ncbi:MAG: alpha-amylase family glycosyl hydrolase [Tepidisphaeraceae bacterium]
MDLPRRENYYPSPGDWRDEVLYFLLPDRFSDGKESGRPLIDRANPATARPAPWNWLNWSKSGGERWQGGTLKGVQSKLDYLGNLGVTTLWIGPVFRQRDHLNTYHGYGIQDFLEVDPHLGTRQDLLDLVDAAHQKKLRIILDIIFNHSGFNWRYPDGSAEPTYKRWPEFYDGPLQWMDASGGTTATITQKSDGVWPRELQDDNNYTRAGKGSLGDEDLEWDHAEAKRTDFFSLRDFNFDGTSTLDFLAKCYKYWIALSDCDGFRIDTMKHVSFEAGRSFCGSIKEYAANLGKADFFLVGEVAGPDSNASKFRDALGRNLSATLDIGESRTSLHAVGKGFAPATDYFGKVAFWDNSLGSHRELGSYHVSILDDHDHVFGSKERFSTNAPSNQIIVPIAIQLLSLSIPCIYYGDEQACASPEANERQWIPGLGGSDRYLREAMFGPSHPRVDGAAGVQQTDSSLPGFGPFGTSGAHAFDPGFSVYKMIAALGKLRKAFPVLRSGRQYLRPIANFRAWFADSPAGELIAWSRILDEDEALIVANPNGSESRGGDVLVAEVLNSIGATFTAIYNSAEAVTSGYSGPHKNGSTVAVKTRNGKAYVEIRDVQPGQVIVFINRP